jgi:hypothetical protein
VEDGWLKKVKKKCCVLGKLFEVDRKSTVGGVDGGIPRLIGGGELLGGVTQVAPGS